MVVSVNGSNSSSEKRSSIISFGMYAIWWVYKAWRFYKQKEKLDIIKSNTKLVRADAQMLGFADNTFDSVVTSCTFCSVPDPVLGLKEIYRVTKPGGKLLMFEHVRSNIFWMGPMMDLLTYVSRKIGPDLNRRTKEHVIRAGFKLTREINIYLDMVKLFEAVKPS